MPLYHRTAARSATIPYNFIFQALFLPNRISHRRAVIIPSPYKSPPLHPGGLISREISGKQHLFPGCRLIFLREFQGNCIRLTSVSWFPEDAPHVKEPSSQPAPKQRLFLNHIQFKTSLRDSHITADFRCSARFTRSRNS